MLLLYRRATLNLLPYYTKQNKLDGTPVISCNTTQNRHHKAIGVNVYPGDIMLQKLALGCITAAILGASGAAAAQTPVKIGFITTLSTPAGYIGQDARDAFNLAIKEGGGKLGGVPVQLEVEDDGLKPGSAKQIVEKMLQDKIKLFTGIIFSNVLTAVAPTVLQQNAFYISNNAGPSPFAGAKCNKNYFVASFENTSPHAAGGVAVNQLGYKRVALVAPNYQAGREALEGFKRDYKGKVVAEIYTKLGQSDFSVELARLRELAPDAIYEFEPGGAGINFAKQYANSGLSKTIPMVLPVFSMDLRMIKATGSAAKGLYTVALWSPELDNPQNRAFVAAFQNAYGRLPTQYAAEAYDTANLIASGLHAVKGDLSKADAFRAALYKADFKSVRGFFKFNTNHHPIQNYYLMQIKPNAQGELLPMVVRKVLSETKDIFAAECPLNR